jgi:hypothetical protein
MAPGLPDGVDAPQRLVVGPGESVQATIEWSTVTGRDNAACPDTRPVTLMAPEVGAAADLTIIDWATSCNLQVHPFVAATPTPTP